MLAFGATGQTLEQLLEFLGHETLDQLRSESPTSKLFAQILANPNGGEGSPDINLANKVWPKAVRKINSWADKKTKGLIPTVLTENDLTGEEDLVFDNALYFKGTWSNPFKANMTKKKKFKLINGKTVSAPFMTNYEKFHYDSKDGLQDLLQMFHSDNALFYGDFNLEKRKLDEVWIPKFKITYKFEAQDVMEEMGLTLPFDPNNKEITKIVGEWTYVSKVLQKSFIEVDETGTEAPAVSIMSMRKGCCRPPPPPPPASFVADHPFMFMIREDTSRAVFFIGAVLNPVENSLA
ncbi:serpin-ZX [Tanacetum coccineum]